MDLMHVTDWLPTFVNLAGGSVKPNNPLDGVDQWETLQNMTPSPRKEVLLNMVDNTTGALRMGDWKILLEIMPQGNPLIIIAKNICTLFLVMNTLT